MHTLVSIYEAKAHLSKLIAKVEQTGEPVTVCRNGKPVVDLVVHTASKDPLEQDRSLKGAVFHGDPCAPADERDWPTERR